MNGTKSRLQNHKQQLFPSQLNRENSDGLKGQGMTGLFRLKKGCK